MFLVILWDRNDREIIIDFHKKVDPPHPTLTQQSSFDLKLILSNILKTFKNERREFERKERTENE